MQTADTPLAPLDGIIDHVPRPIRRAIAAYTIGKTLHSVYLAGRKIYNERLSYVITVEGSDDLYPLVHTWLLDVIPEARHRSLTAETSERHSGLAQAAPDDGTPAAPRPQDRLRLKFGGTRIETVVLGGHRIQVQTHKEDQSSSLNALAKGDASLRRYLKTKESVTFTSATAAGRDAVLDLLRMLDNRAQEVDTSIPLWIANPWGGWDRHGSVRPRPLDTVYLDDDTLKDLTDDLARFLAARQDYERLGVPYHRGYLLSGPPGTGKTSTARALSSHFRIPLRFISLPAMREDSDLLRLVSGVGENQILLIEDVDVAPASREREAEDHNVSLTALLNALDGVVTPEGLITIITTNHPEVLDEALTRAGRIDRHFEFDYLTTRQLHDLLEGVTGLRPAATLRVAANLTPADVIEHVKQHIGAAPQDMLDSICQALG